jgi:hypothetical protein
MGRGFQAWKFHLKISPWEEKPCLPRAYGPWEAKFSYRGLIFGGEEISIPETRPIRKSYISLLKVGRNYPYIFQKATKSVYVIHEWSLRELRVLDETTAKPFSMPPEMYDDLIGDDEALQENWDRICEIYEEMQSQGLCVCGNPGLGEVRTLLLENDVIKDESAIEYVLRHMYVKRIDLLKIWTKEKLSKIQSVEENEDSFILIGNHRTDIRIRKTNNSKIISECSFEDSKQSLVIDLDFVKNLPMGTRFLISNKLLPELININKAGVHPFDLVMTNLGDLENYYSIRKQLPKSSETVEHESLCEKWTDKCHTELFPKENLVLVSPFSENELVYDPNDTYVITALAGPDENEDRKALEKAENDGIRHSIYIRTVSSKCLLSALHNCLKLVYGQFGQSNMIRTFLLQTS